MKTKIRRTKMKIMSDIIISILGWAMFLMFLLLVMTQ
jgi:hypothetical protein